MMQRKKPMARSPFKRRANINAKVKSVASINPHSGAAVLKGAMHKKKPKPGKDPKMLEACRGEPCYLVVPGVCLPSAESVVPCHSNEQQHGKGMGKKADDKYTVPGCTACHAWLDQGRAPREERFGTWRAAHREWEPVRAAKLGLPPEICDEDGFQGVARGEREFRAAT